MAKILLVILVTVVVVWLFRSMGRKSSEAAPKPPKAKVAEDMVRCQVCGVNLPRSEALMTRGRFYCCEAHRQQDATGR